MAAFDSEVLLREQNRVAQLEHDIQLIQTSFQQQSNEVTYLRNLAHHNVAQSMKPGQSIIALERGSHEWIDFGYKESSLSSL